MSKLIKFDHTEIYDTLVIGAGPAAVSAAIYASRKGLKTAMVGELVGGQVNDTNEIENIIGLPLTNGFDFSLSLEKHLEEYEIAFYKGHLVKEIKIVNGKKIVITDDNKEVISKTLIIATGAKWRKLNVEGEDTYTAKGVHYCSTCDGPFYRNKEVVIVGGGNSGVESAIYLSSIASKVTLLEAMDKLKADKILQDKLYALNVDVKLNTLITKMEGSQFLEKIILNNGEILNVDGVFVEIGLSSNSDLVKNLLNLNKFGEIIVDEYNMSSIEGIFAAGDCTNVKHKQIVIAMGEGAKAALSAFEYLLKSDEK